MKSRFSVALGFLGLIAFGALVLASPWARVAGGWGAPLTALFTACSAVCVTGLTVVDIAAEYTRFGQIVLLALVEIGCLGLMTVGTFFIVAIGRRLSLAREFTLVDAYGAAGVKGLKGLVCWVIGSMLTLEAFGAAALYWRWGDLYQSIFYSVMGFCNAGFSILPGSLAAFGDDPFVVLVLACETVLGGIGFLVIYNLCTFRFLRRRASARVGRLTLHTRVVLRVTAVLLSLSFAVVLLIEWDGAFAAFSPARKLWTAFYQAVTPRTCGFCLVPTEALHPLTRHLYEILMFIGGAPGSAAAGMKVTTLAVLVYTILAMCRGETETILGQRTLPHEVVRESIVILVALISFAMVVVGVLLVTEHGGPLAVDALVFEAVSAITTTGLSMGETTARLSPAGKVAIMVAMFVGRLGALTVVMMIGDRETVRHIRYPQEDLVVG
jgi:trk system potassium uptake protein TrkH